MTEDLNRRNELKKMPLCESCTGIQRNWRRAPAIAQKQTQSPDPRYQTVTPSRDSIGKVYMGREIAGVMGWQGASWLERDERQQEERSECRFGSPSHTIKVATRN